MAWWSAWHQNESAYLLFAELHLRPANWLSCGGRITMHETDSYETRIYAAESFIPGAGMANAMYEKGMRTAAVAETRWSWGSFTAAWTCSVRPGVRSLSSGNDEVTGDTLGRLSMQLELRL